MSAHPAPAPGLCGGFSSPTPAVPLPPCVEEPILRGLGSISRRVRQSCTAQLQATMVNLRPSCPPGRQELALGEPSHRFISPRCRGHWEMGQSQGERAFPCASG